MTGILIVTLLFILTHLHTLHWNIWEKYLDTSVKLYQASYILQVARMEIIIRSPFLDEVRRKRIFPKEFLKEGYPNLLMVPPGDLNSHYDNSCGPLLFRSNSSNCLVNLHGGLL